MPKSIELVEFSPAPAEPPDRRRPASSSTPKSRWQLGVPATLCCSTDRRTLTAWWKSAIRSTLNTGDRAMRGLRLSHCSNAPRGKPPYGLFGQRSVRNPASRQLVVQYRFVEVGEQWDDEDGLETIFEVNPGVRQIRRAP